MTKSIAKLTVLTVLVVLSVYQVGMLWFDYPSNRNFFYDIIDSDNITPSIDQAENYDVFTPETLAAYQGPASANYLLYNIQNDESELVSSGIKAIREGLKSGYKDQSYISNEAIYDKQHLLFDLPFKVKAHMLASNLGISSSWLENSMSFDRVYIYPGQYSDDYMELVYTDASLENKYLCKIQVGEVSELNNLFNAYLDDPSLFNEKKYISTKQRSLEQKQFEKFKEDVLVPNNREVFNYLQSLYGEPYFYIGDVRQTEALREYVDYFIPSPEIAWSTGNDKSIRFGDLEVVISYNDQGVFTYGLVDPIVGKETSLNHAYSAAETFLKKDTILSQIQYSLADYEESDQGISFYYNYNFRNVPIVFADLEKEIGQKYPMKITVVGNTVVSYTRFMWKMQEVVVQGNPFQATYQQVLDSLINEYGEHVVLNDMYLGYYVSDIGDGANLEWVVDLPGERRIYELE